MASHIRVVAWLHIVFGGLGLCAALVALFLFGGAAGLVSMGGQDGRIAASIMGILAVVAFVALLVLSLPGLIAGVGLLSFRPWARILMIILSALHLLNVPLGTALGAYGLWALLSNEGSRLFERPPGLVVQPR
jgi:hypothetical protein